jgi:PAS domain S-box-containing protein
LLPETKLVFGFGLAFTVLVAVGVIQYRSIQALIETDRWVARTHAVLTELEGVYSGVQEAESGARGYAATGKDNYRQQQAAGTIEARDHLRILHSLISDNPVQIRNLDSLASLAGSKTAQLDQLVEIRRTQGLAVACQHLSDLSGLGLMTDLRAQIDVMESVEGRLLASRQAASRIRARVADVLTVVATLLAIVFVLVGGWITRRDARARRRTQEALQRASTYNRSLLEASLDPLVTIAPDGKITDVNKAAEQVTGCSRQELVGTDFSDYFTDPQKARLGYQQVFREGRVQDYELEVRHRDGHATPVFYNASLYRDEDENVVGVFAAARDITARKRVEQALRISEERYRSLTMASVQVIWTTNAAGLVAGDMPSWREFTGQSEKEIQGWGWANALHPDDRERTAAVWSKAVATCSRYDTEYRLRNKDGDYRYVVARGVPVLEAGGSIREWIGSCADITERKRAEESLRRANAYNRSLLEASLDPLVTIAPDGKITDVNKATEQVTGFTRQELVGTDFSDYFTDPQKARASYQQVYREGSVQDYELNVRHRDGHITPVVYNASLYRDEAGNAMGVFAAARDITERKRAEEALKQYSAELARSNADLQQFAYVASHDLQEPLRMVASYTQLLARRYKGKLDADADDFIAFAVDGAHRMKNLINDLLAYSRVGTRGKQFASTNCEAVLQEVIENLQTAIEESSAAVTYDPLPEVWADASQLVQVFQNLIGNALKFHGRQPPRVHIASESQDGHWRFVVRDNGIGIEPQYLERIFVIFQRLHTHAEYPGAGMGLAIAKKIVERHGGRIWVESKRGEGSTFYFTIPKNTR